MADEDEAGSGGTVASGNSSGVVAHLVRSNKRLELDNKKLRDRLKEARTQAETAKPADGAVVLSAEEAKRWAAFQKIEGEPAEIAKQVEAAKQATAKLLEYEERERDREAAAAIGFNPNVLSDLRRTKALALEMRDSTVEEKGGKKVVKKLPHVRPSGDEKAQWTPLREYAETQLKDYLPALAAAEGSGPDSERTAPSWPPQRGEERKPAGYDPVAAGKAMAEAQKKASASESLAFR